MPNKETFAKMIEHTQLKPYTTSKEIEKLCLEALQWNFYGVCLYPTWIPLAQSLLTSSPIKIITVAGFPTGAESTQIKCLEVAESIEKGANEIDFVINIGWLKEKRLKMIEAEFKYLVELSFPIPLKAILETCYLNDEEKKIACELALETGISFIKTSTGFGSSGATVEDIKLIKKFFPHIKASGGIQDIRLALDLIQAGASRIGTSAGVKLIEALESISQ
jgi:deoxyribose-phosphate aldolase